MTEENKFLHVAGVKEVAELLEITPQWARNMVDKYLHGNKIKSEYPLESSEESLIDYFNWFVDNFVDSEKE